jgi:type IV pilus assembly protein PilA
MFSTLRRQGARDGGFTLLELMVVVLIVAILIAIAIPTFLGAQRRAQDRAAQSRLRSALMVEKSIYADTRAYSSNVTATGPLRTGEPSLTFRANATMPASTAESVYVYVPAGGASVTLGSRSTSGRCFYVRDVASGTGAGTFYAQNTTCTRPSATTVTGARWT